jgi:hypothetical protein
MQDALSEQLTKKSMGDEPDWAEQRRGSHTADSEFEVTHGARSHPGSRETVLSILTNPS